MTTTEEFEGRPRARLLELLDRRGLTLGEFAHAANLADPPPAGWRGKHSAEAEHRQRCLVKIRTYTHGPRYTPPAEMIVRWAAAFRVDPGYFWSTGETVPEPIADDRCLAMEVLVIDFADACADGCDPDDGLPEIVPEVSDALATVPSKRRLLALARAASVRVARSKTVPELRAALTKRLSLARVLPLLTPGEWLTLCERAGLTEIAQRSRGAREADQRAAILGLDGSRS